MHWVKLDSLLYREVQYGPQSMQSPGDHSLFFQGFLRSSCWSINSCWSTTIGYVARKMATMEGGLVWFRGGSTAGTLFPDRWTCIWQQYSRRIHQRGHLFPESLSSTIYPGWIASPVSGLSTIPMNNNSNWEDASVTNPVTNLTANRPTSSTYSWSKPY